MIFDVFFLCIYFTAIEEKQLDNISSYNYTYYEKINEPKTNFGEPYGIDRCYTNIALYILTIWVTNNMI